MCFWFVGAALAMAPASAGLPNARLLVIPSIGFSIGIVGALRELVRPLPSGRIWFAWWVASLPVGLLLSLSLFTVSPLSLLWTSGAPLPAVARVRPSANPLVALPSQDAIVVNYPDWFGLPLLKMSGKRGATPNSIAQLASASEWLDIERVDERTLILRAPLGLRGVPGYVTRPAPFAAGDQVLSRRFLAEVVETLPNGEPTAVRYSFDTALEHPSLAWFTAAPDGFAPITPPRLGGHALIRGFFPPAGR
jgi:hypothetical protein